MGEALNLEVSCPSTYVTANNIDISEEEAKLSCIFNEEVHHIPTPPTGSGEGIHANDIGSLLEQFLEYEQGSDGELTPGLTPSSHQESFFITPVGSPGYEQFFKILFDFVSLPSGPNDDVVLGRLMIVQEKLTQEVENNISPTTSCEEGNIQIQNDNNNLSAFDGLLRTVNGVHPKGDNTRMADSPKFAKFKKKKQIIEIPRRCHSGPTTPRSISPKIINQEELKKQEAKLIEALALTAFKSDAMNKGDTVDINKAKRNLIDKKNSAKRKSTEPIASRLMPVVSKRQRKIEQEKLELLNKTQGKAFDPRLIKNDYCETSNTTFLMNTNLDQINAAMVTDADDTSIDNIGIVDMTIDHEALAGTIITPSKIDQRDELASTQVITSPINENHTQVHEQTVNHGEKNSMIEQLEELHQPPSQLLTLNEIKTEPADFENSTVGSYMTSPTVPDTITPVKMNELEMKLLEDTTNEIKFKSKTPRSIQLVKPHSMKPPKNYRQTNNNEFSNSASDSESDLENDIKRRKLKIESTKKVRPRAKSRANSRARSRSPIDRSRPNSPIPRSQLYDTRRSKEDGWRSKKNGKLGKQNSDEENIDISNKLSELSNPVPYDIEHERKVQFLVGKKKEGYTERKNIYVGGIDKQTTKQDLVERFRRFGKIEKTTLHFREKGDNYAFIVYEHPECAKRAIDEGNDDPTYPRLELCFGGRRKFVGGSYVDFDGNNSYLEETEQNSRNFRSASPENDFDSLLKMATQNIKRRREETPEWD